MVLYDSQIDRVYQYLLIGSVFLLPLTVLGNNIFIWSIVLIWLFSGNYINKTKELMENKLALASIVFLAYIYSDCFGLKTLVGGSK